MTKKVRIRTHPGEMLNEEFLVPLGISGRELALAIGVPPNRITDLIRGRRGMTADTAIRLGKYFKTTAQMWMSMQAAYDMSIAQSENDYSDIKARA